MPETGITFASFLTPEGAIVAAGLVMSFIEIIKKVIPALDAAVSGALMAFVLTGILYALTGASVGVPSLDAGLAIFLSWLGCATAAIGIKSTIVHATSRGDA